ncbi:MAG: ester cyclase [Verrucomicrobiota bacterium]
MSTTSNKLLARRFLEQIVNTGEVDRLHEFLAPGFVASYANSRGIKWAREHILTFRHCYPDMQVTVDGQVGEGDVVVTWWTMRGTHQGEWKGIQPTHELVTLTGVNVQRIHRGLILEQWGAANTLEALMAAGVVRWAKRSTRRRSKRLATKG